ncbi:MAG: hypothetical protein HY921_01780 [Elusimicrobia bacterium]|nr:hypothetical protein [Elusimicrobiota bacterium]
MSKKENAAKAHKEPKPVEEIILNYQGEKYAAIPLAAQWAKVLRRKEENRHLTSNELLDLSLRDVLGGEVDWKDLKKAMASAPAEASEAPNGVEAKSKN